MIADDHFDVDYWNTETGPSELEFELEPSDNLLTISSLPSTTLGVTAIKLYGARFLLYDTPGICPSAYRIRLLTSMLSEEQKKAKLLFPRKALVPTVFSLHPNHSILLGALGHIDYVANENVFAFSLFFSLRPIRSLDIVIRLCLSIYAKQKTFLLSSQNTQERFSFRPFRRRSIWHREGSCTRATSRFLVCSTRRVKCETRCCRPLRAV